MLPVGWYTIRVFVHVLAATVWVGGQLVLAGLVPALRAAGAGIPRIAARRFNTIAWPAFGVLVATGVWNVAVDWGKVSDAYRMTLIIKVIVVVASGLTAYLHARAKRPAPLAIFGSLTAITALAAVFLGVMLA
jgi:putative copper export protein